MGIRVLRSHARGQNHLHLSKKITDFLSSTNKTSTTETSSTKSLNSATSSRKHPTLEVSFVTAQETLAEIRWAIEFSMYFFVWSENKLKNAPMLLSKTVALKQSAKKIKMFKNFKGLLKCG